VQPAGDLMGTVELPDAALPLCGSRALRSGLMRGAADASICLALLW
jgi:hypothetical protein